ncbi:hypothetical protein CfE428DRAFT_2375 [Chthoniobacter flavus Ellin428]|uniref:Secreted protein n=1 Tax=Chthoniobacter flavus Ellin428 TaxID=497964 RepID=B4D194_9BACT|nr:hypothetical protein [Chthoniobacter flavus]EDY19786.1 hypothetical protein CfE428DRAFT_2375 [Chthoniobacter flavus Ellin428]TCO91940.1 hypothetical protein EV701_107221 [Chthoniobacter flavus]
MNNSRLLSHAFASFTFSALAFLACALFLGSPTRAHAGWGKPDADFSNYDVPVFEQITNHIKAKVTAKLAKGKLAHDRYFIIPFAYENKGNDPAFSHSFMSVIRVFANDRHPQLTEGLELRRYQNRDFEAFTISWIPHDFDRNPDLCVFDGFGSRLFASWNKCPISPGKSFKLDETIKLGVNAKNAIGMWGPYEITETAFNLAVRRLHLLNSGAIKYRADDRLTRKDRIAINCFHAMAGLEELFPNGGLFGTGFKMWGLNGTRRVLIEYKARATKMGLLLDPVDIKKDLYGFVYAPSRNSRDIYDPFDNTASAYHR